MRTYNHDGNMELSLHVLKKKEKRFGADLRKFKESRFAENNPATFGGAMTATPQPRQCVAYAPLPTTQG